MSEITSTKVGAKPLAGDGDNVTVTWGPISTGDTCTPLEGYADYPERTVHVFGTFNAATVTLQGSLNGTDYATLNDPQGNALTFVTATTRIEAVAEVTPYIKPIISGGGSDAVTVVLFLRRSKT